MPTTTTSSAPIDPGGEPPGPLSRRRFLLAGGVVLAAAACSSDGATAPAPGVSEVAPSTTPGSTESTSTESTPIGSVSAASPSRIASATAFAAADFDGLTVCGLTPKAAAGPFPLDEQFLRRDITEGYLGHPLRLGIRVVDAACAPVAGAAVEIWHTDATGDYSAFVDNGSGKDEAEGTTFLRGTQVAGDDGIVEFATIYPGWYPGRAVHIHTRVRVDDSIVLTSQLYFDQDYTAEVYSADPYAEFGLPDTANSNDRIAGDFASALITTVADGAGSIGLANLGVAT